MKKEKPFTTGDIAKYCHVTQVGVLKWIKSGKLKAYSTPGGHYRILRHDFRNFLQQYKMPIDESFFSGIAKRVLVVDDEPTMVELVIQSLQPDSPNYVFATAGDGYEAGLQMAAFKPDVVILNSTMPQLDGCEDCQRIKSEATTQHIRVLAITDLVQDTKLRAAGADYCLTKPLQTDELRTHVRRLVGFSRRRDDTVPADVRDGI